MLMISRNKTLLHGAGQNTLLYHHTHIQLLLYPHVIYLSNVNLPIILLLLYHHTTVTILYHHTTVTILYHHMHTIVTISSYYCYCTQHTTVTIRSYTLLYSVTIPSYYPIFSGADPYCIVKCGRKKVKTPVIKNTLNPTFSSKVNFYISNPATTEVTVQVK